MKKVIIIGVGNILRRDDGVGVHVIKELVGASASGGHVPLQLPNGVEVYDGGLGGFRLLDFIGGAKKAIFIDAIEMGLPPGSVRVFSPQEVVSLLSASGGQRCSLHDTDLLEVIKFAETLDDTPEIKIVGIQPANVESGLELSVPVKDSIPRTVQLILDIIR
ncbi:MAG: hydrogenase maturation protease [Planctomycetes bacterium]|nr:hydrogenase maturation protease [Planctomycetota bacterium]